jgi:hypothetical protein
MSYLPPDFAGGADDVGVLLPFAVEGADVEDDGGRGRCFLDPPQLHMLQPPFTDPILPLTQRKSLMLTSSIARVSILAAGTPLVE